jgi:hypothetical protein
MARVTQLLHFSVNNLFSFYMYLQTVPACNASYIQQSVALASLGYIGVYPPAIDCYYSVQFREMFNITVHVHHFKLDGAVNSTCQDFLEVR